MTARVLLSALALAAFIGGQQTRREVVKATTPEQDGKPNSPAVPEVYAIPGQFERVLVLRFKYDTDSSGTPARPPMSPA